MQWHLCRALVSCGQTQLLPDYVLLTYYSEHPLLFFSNFLGTRLLVDGRGRILEHFEQTKHEVYQAGCLTLLPLASNYESDVTRGTLVE